MHDISIVMLREMGKTLRLEYQDGKYMDIEVAPGTGNGARALGPADRINSISKKAFDAALDAMVNIISEAHDKIQNNINNNKIDELSLEVGFSVSAEGSFFIANCSSQGSISLSVTIKNEE